MIRIGTLACLLLVGACTGTDDGTTDTDSDVVGETDDSSVIDSAEDTDIADTDVVIDTDRETDTGFDTDETDTDTDLPPCPVDWARDCANQCSALSLLGNGFCEEGPGTKPDFNCEDFEFDGGDCLDDTDTDVETDVPVCPFPGEEPDCNGVCFNVTLLRGDGTCDDGSLGADLQCPEFNFDDGDCEPDTDPTDVPETDVDTFDTDLLQPCPGLLDTRDCNGECYYEGWIGDAQCDAGQQQPFGSPDFDCAFHNFDGGDCIIDTDVDTDDTDTDGVFDTDTDVSVDTDTDGVFDTDTDVETDLQP